MEDLEKLIIPLRVNQSNHITEEGDEIKITNNGSPLVTIYPEENRAEFHGYFKEIGRNIKPLESFIEGLEKLGYETNLDNY